MNLVTPEACRPYFSRPQSAALQKIVRMGFRSPMKRAALLLQKKMRLLTKIDANGLPTPTQARIVTRMGEDPQGLREPQANRAVSAGPLPNYPTSEDNQQSFDIGV